MMKTILGGLVWLLSLTLTVPSHGMGNTGSNNIYRVSDGAYIPLEEMIRDLESVRLVFVGELHTNESHHKAQLEVVRSLNNRGDRVLTALEMFRKDHQKELDRWVSGKIGEQEFKEVYLRNWNFPWKLYKDIFLYCREHDIPMIGLNVRPEITRQVAKEGFASLTPEQRGQLPFVGCIVDPEYEAFIRRAFSFHHHGGSEFTHFCEAQLVWDTAMARNLTASLDQYPERIAVILAGNGHAWKFGIPRQIITDKALSYRVILPEIPGRLDPDHVSIQEADYLWLSK